MQSESSQKRRFGPGRIFLAALTLLLWVGLGIISSSPYLHQLLHKDSHEVTHTCAITQWGKGPHEAVSTSEASLPLPPQIWVTVTSSERPQFPQPDNKTRHGRGPPQSRSLRLIAG